MLNVTENFAFTNQGNFYKLTNNNPSADLFAFLVRFFLCPLW